MRWITLDLRPTSSALPKFAMGNREVRAEKHCYLCGSTKGQLFRNEDAVFEAAFGELNY
jgi:hypothetical protein